MSAIMDVDDFAAAQTPPRPTISSHKQARINVWRTEVASLNRPQSPRRPDCSSAQSVTTTATNTTGATNSSSSTAAAGSSALGDNAALAQRARRKPSFWRRLTRRLRGKDDEELFESGIAANGLRTEMYKEELSTWAAAAAAQDVSSDGGRGLMDTQERLERAARLLSEGVEKR